MKNIHFSKLWPGAVFALEIEDNYGNPKFPIVWYHMDYISEKYIEFTAMHTHKSYTRNFIPDRWVWLRS